MAGNAGKGRPKGSRNRRTEALMANIGNGETPVEFGIRLMWDETQPIDLRLHAARMVAPYVHAKPTPAGETVSIALPDAADAAGIVQASAQIMQAVAKGQMTVSTGRDLMAMLDSHRKGLELTVVEERISALEEAAAGQR